jgi:hypothetical protein
MPSALSGLVVYHSERGAFLVIKSRFVTCSLLAAAATFSIAAGTALAKPAKSAGGGEPTEAQMRQAVLELVQFKMSRVGMQVGIEYFEKIGCEKAQGAIGYNCDYFVRYTGGAFDFGNSLMGKNSVTEASGRFVFRNGRWTILQTR